MTMLSSSSPVRARTMSGGRAIPARSSTYSSVASPCWTWCSNSSSSWRNRHIAGAHRLGEDVDRSLRRADRAQAARGVKIGPGRVEHADDDAVDVEALLGHLADDDVRVVAVGRH